MKAAIVAFLLVNAAGLTIARPLVDAPISPGDVDEICKVIRTITASSVQNIEAICTNKKIPGAIPTDGEEVTPRGVSPKTFYKRTDRVTVQISNPGHVGGITYTLQKSADKWRIVAEGRWIR